MSARTTSPILQHGDERLATVCSPIDEYGRRFATVADDIIASGTNRDARCLAAPQIGYPARIIAVCFGASSRLQVIANPVFSPADDARRVKSQETCLSVEHGRHVVEVLRWENGTLMGCTRTGAPFVRELFGEDALVVQHELDHLDGICLPERFELAVQEAIDEVVQRAPATPLKPIGRWRRFWLAVTLAMHLTARTIREDPKETADVRHD